MNKKIAIIGFFAYNTAYNGGQENKTRALKDLLVDKYGNNAVEIVDTLNWKKKPIRLLFKTFVNVKRSDIVIMLPARKGVKVFSRILLLFKRKNTKLFYSVIGGWLPTITISNPGLKKCLEKFNGIWVETKSMCDDLTKQGFKNIIVVPNFKRITPISETKLNDSYEMPYKICTFSRVIKEKGIEDAIKVVESINNMYKKEVYTLDIYGRIDTNYVKEFNEIIDGAPKYIKYKGIVPYNDTVKIIKNYFFLLFPTRFSTEGIPGTIIDAYAAGIPIVSAKWNSYNDVIVEGATGIGFKQFDVNDMKKKLLYIAKKPDTIISKKKACIKEFYKYTEDSVFDIIKKEF